ncbi:MAG TPA: DUF1573 domain-containing protein [Bacteroidales bacterium]|nr:DUF1573 domain-containing protein [Bacteroidales bacterium]HPZ35922.1 DUF1573 domain-containing protein [Bacteroidales bacterium]HQD34658.1 DUF1573 domain-containing protein [Bacteroidales bacterium]
MKALKIFVILIFVSQLSMAQTTNGPIIKFDKQSYNFGEITQGAKAEVDFIFTNTGNEPLILSNVRSSCGCTVPKWTNEPVKPGEQGKITVKYDSNRIGSFSKQITVSSNANNGNVILLITGKVNPKPAEAIPYTKTDASGTPIAQ